MGRCYGCSQENCGYTQCNCGCHSEDLARDARKIRETQFEKGLICCSDTQMRALRILAAEKKVHPIDIFDQLIKQETQRLKQLLDS